jgi:hypothetical protein
MAEGKTYIWRMTHYRNIGFIIRNGLHCCNCEIQDPEYINIGHRSLIDNRGQAAITIEPGGVLNDYIPFYFHYKMPMLYQIHKGLVKDYTGTQEEIIYLVTTAEKIAEHKLPFIITDRHAYLAHKTVYNELQNLEKLSWDIIKDDTWYYQYSDLRKELKQAEFLIYRHVPEAALLGIITHNDEIAKFVKSEVQKAGSSLQVVSRPAYYYL